MASTLKGGTSPNSDVNSTEKFPTFNGYPYSSQALWASASDAHVFGPPQVAQGGTQNTSPVIDTEPMVCNASKARFTSVDDAS